MTERVDNPIKDEPTAEAALAKLVLAIMDVPNDAVHADITFGLRASGLGWYWGLTWSFHTGSVDRQLRQFDHGKYVKEATAAAMKRVTEGGLPA